MLCCQGVKRITEAFQGVKATRDTTLKTSNMGIFNQWQVNCMCQEYAQSETKSTRKDGNIVPFVLFANIEIVFFPTE